MRAIGFALVGAATWLGVAAGAQATEFGQTHVDLGYLAILGGFAPPADLPYVRADTTFVLASRLNDRNGHPVSLDLGSLGRDPINYLGNSAAEVLSFAYAPRDPLPFIGARIGFAAYTFVAAARAEAQVVGSSSGGGETIGGLGDTTIIPFFLNFEAPGALLHVNLSPAEFTVPTGRYDRNDPIGANVGLNYFSYRPAIVATYLNPRGLEIDLNTSLSFNWTNPATHYRSGDEFGVTFAALQHLSRAFALGIEGYYYRQFTGDRLNDVVVNTVRPVDPLAPFDPLDQGPGNKGQVFAIGPALAWSVTPTIATDLRLQHEVFSDNRRQGEVIWSKISASF